MVIKCFEMNGEIAMKERKHYFIKCPVCDKATEIKIYSSTVLLNFPLMCTWCNTESVINVVDLKMTVAEKPL